jgi:hypothetical protein
MISRIGLSVVIAILLTGCGSGVRFVRTDETLYAPKPKNAPVAVLSGDSMDPHVVLGTLTTAKKMKASFDDRSIYDEALGDLKACAREVGADALARVTPRVRGEGMDGKLEVEATAIRYLTRATTVTTTEASPAGSN